MLNIRAVVLQKQVTRNETRRAQMTEDERSHRDRCFKMLSYIHNAAAEYLKSPRCLVASVANQAEGEHEDAPSNL